MVARTRCPGPGQGACPRESGPHTDGSLLLLAVTLPWAQPPRLAQKQILLCTITRLPSAPGENAPWAAPERGPSARQVHRPGNGLLCYGGETSESLPVAERHRAEKTKPSEHLPLRTNVLATVTVSRFSGSTKFISGVPTSVSSSGLSRLPIPSPFRPDLGGMGGGI